MPTYITLLLIGISLSMDAFSLSLAYGISGVENKDKICLSIIVGTYHFIMPLIGFMLSKLLINIKYININIIAFLILLYVGLNLIFSKEEENIKTNILGFILFGLSVSLDSLTVGLGLTAITKNILLPPIIFSITSLTFTYLGLNLGTIIKQNIKSSSKVLGGLILIIIAIFILLK